MLASPDSYDASLRLAMFRHLDSLLSASEGRALRSSEINTFIFEGRGIPLIVQSGIWKPRGLSAALTIRTTYTDPRATPRYDDSSDLYAYRGSDPNLSDNRALREAWRGELPLAYFVGVAKGVYQPIYPVWVTADHPDRLCVSINGEPGTSALRSAPVLALERAYAVGTRKQRLHQRIFRDRVLDAYSYQCAMCRLRHPPLLDAAHIVPDAEEGGEPVVPNGLSLCKIHHAAYDMDIIGVRPDYVIDVREDVLHETDGPMLRHGIQDLQGGQLILPSNATARPDRDRLAVRYSRFKQTA